MAAENGDDRVGGNVPKPYAVVLAARKEKVRVGGVEFYLIHGAAVANKRLQPGLFKTLKK